jgi:lysyl endopeptidase
MDRSVIMRSVVYRSSFLSMLMFLSTIVHGQLTRPGNPLPLHYPGLKSIAVYELQVSEQEKKWAMNGPGESLLKPARSGMLIDSDYSPDNAGTWDTLTNGTRVWRIAFKVEGARLLSLIFKPFHVNSGTKIFLYDPMQQTILGAFSDLNNRANQVLATGQIPGEMLILEVQIPPFASSAFSLTIAHIGCDFAEKAGQKVFKDGWFGWSGACNVDVACMNQADYQLVKNAVVRIVYFGNERCTGTLLNNTREDGRNYVLTAEHCINTEDDANTAVFYFSYESPYCKGPDGSSSKSVSGATIRATSSNLDFSLLELIEPVPLNYHPYYAGWDNTAIPPASAYSIHHPQGDVKKISIDTDPPTVANFGDKYNHNTHWLVSRWETGTTEAGSSGGGMFDPYNRVRGSLTGGQASCINSVNDYFQMLSHDWKDYPANGNQLAYWLDPLDTKTNLIDGFDPYRNFWESGDTLSNILPAEIMQLDENNLGWGAWSGHNSLYISQFAERFAQKNKKEVLGVILHTAHNHVASAASHLVVKIWQDQELPGQVIYEKVIPLVDLSANAVQFIEFDSIVSVTDSFFAGYELFYNNPLDTFSTYMAVNRQIDPFSTAYIFDNQWYSLENYTGGSLNSSFAIMPVVFDSIPNDGPSVESSSEIIIYPNPADSYSWIEFKQMLAYPVRLTVYNVQGDIVADKEYGPYQRSLRLETAGFGMGVYFIRAKRGEQVGVAKMVVIR